MGLDAEDLEPQGLVTVGINFYWVIEQFAERLVTKDILGLTLGELASVFEEQTWSKTERISST